MADAPQTKPRIDFNALYLDTNVLIRSGWPSPSVGLNNILLLGTWSGVRLFIPEAVLMEAEEHWIRSVQDRRTGLDSASRQLERIARFIGTPSNIEHLSIERMVEEYRAAVKAAMAKYQMNICPFTTVSAQEMFNLAIRYKLPFELEQEGKGFQDAVILSSVLQHLKVYPDLMGILVTADGAFGKAEFAAFEAAISDARLRICDLDRLFALLWEPYWDETVTKPYAVERENARAAAEASIPVLKEFITTHLSESMLKVGMFDKVLKLLAIGEIKVMYVQTPFPTPEQPNRHVRIAIAVSAECTAVVEKDYSIAYSYLKLGGEPTKPVEEEQTFTWFGGVEATAAVEERQFRNLTPVSLLSMEELGSDKRWKRE